MDRGARIWSIRFIAFCGVYLLLFRTSLASEAADAVLSGLNRLGGVYAFFLAPFLAVAGVFRAFTGRSGLLRVLVGGSALAFFCLAGQIWAIEFALIASLGFLGAVMSYLIAGLAAFSLFLGDTSFLAGGSAVIGPLGDLLAVVSGPSALANVIIIAAAVLIPILASTLTN